MSTLAWIVVAGLAMSALALVGTVTLVLPPARLERILLPGPHPRKFVRPGARVWIRGEG